MIAMTAKEKQAAVLGPVISKIRSTLLNCGWSGKTKTRLQPHQKEPEQFLDHLFDLEKLNSGLSIKLTNSVKKACNKAKEYNDKYVAGEPGFRNIGKDGRVSRNHIEHIMTGTAWLSSVLYDKEQMQSPNNKMVTYVNDVPKLTRAGTLFLRNYRNVGLVKCKGQELNEDTRCSSREDNSYYSYKPETLTDVFMKFS